MSAGDDGSSFDRSLADLMAGVAVVFLLLAAIFILRANAARQEAVDQKERLERRVGGQKEQVAESLGLLHAQLAGLNSQMDGGFIRMGDIPDGGLNVLEIEFVNFAFDFGRCKTPARKRQDLRLGAVPMVQAICGAVDAIADAGASPSIILEGHTDDRPFAQPSGECGVVSTAPGSEFENNVRASGARAQSVFFTLRSELSGHEAEEACLERHFVVAGRGQAAPKHPEAPSDEENRRLVIRVRGDLEL